MDFAQLVTLLEVAKQGSFSRAAEKVLLSQPAVSAQIRQLEEEYGEKLFDRAGKTVRLTPVGEVLADYARRLLALRNESLRAVADHRATTRGVLTIGANEATFLYVLPDVLAWYHGRYPEVKITVFRSFSHKIQEKVEDGSIDLGVVTLPIKAPSLKVIPIFRDPIKLMVSVRSPLARKKSVSMSQVAEQPLIMPRTGNTRRLMEKHLRPYRYRVTMELTSVVMIKRFVAAGLGASLISARFAREEVRAGKVKLLALQDVELWRELGLVYRRDRSLPQSASAFVAAVRERLLGRKGAE